MKQIKKQEMKKLDGEEDGKILVRTGLRVWPISKKKAWAKNNVKSKMKKMKKNVNVSLMEKDLLIAGAMVLGLPCCKRQKCLEFNC